MWLGGSSVVAAVVRGVLVGGFAGSGAALVVARGGRGGADSTVTTRPGQNPTSGVVVHYQLAAADQKVKLEFLAPDGSVIKSYESADSASRAAAAAAAAAARAAGGGGRRIEDDPPGFAQRRWSNRKSGARPLPPPLSTLSTTASTRSEFRFR